MKTLKTEQEPTGLKDWFVNLVTVVVGSVPGTVIVYLEKGTQK